MTEYEDPISRIIREQLDTVQDVQPLTPFMVRDVPTLGAAAISKIAGDTYRAIEADSTTDGRVDRARMRVRFDELAAAERGTGGVTQAELAFAYYEEAARARYLSGGGAFSPIDFKYGEFADAMSAAHARHLVNAGNPENRPAYQAVVSREIAEARRRGRIEFSQRVRSGTVWRRRA